MPSNVEEKAILQQRAQLIARQDIDQEEDTCEQYIRFKLGNTELYGVPYHYAEKILPATKITPVPCTPPIIAGVVNYRGELLTVLDLKHIFSTKQSNTSDKSWIIIVKDGAIKAGLVVDEIEDNDEYIPSKLAPSMGSNEFIQGVHSGTVVILNIGSILADPSLQVDESTN